MLKQIKQILHLGLTLSLLTINLFWLWGHPLLFFKKNKKPVMYMFYLMVDSCYDISLQEWTRKREVIVDAATSKFNHLSQHWREMSKKINHALKMHGHVSPLIYWRTGLCLNTYSPSGDSQGLGSLEKIFISVALWPQLSQYKDRRKYFIDSSSEL